MFIALITANLLMVGGFLLNYNHLPPQIPLFYSRLWGEAQLADVWFVFMLPLFLDIFFFLNFYIFSKFFLPNDFVRKVFLTLNWFLIIVTTAIFLRTVFFIS